MTAKKMVLCPHCRAKLHYDPERLGSGTAAVRCPGCQLTLHISGSGLLAEGDPASPSGRPEPQAAAAAAEEADNTAAAPPPEAKREKDPGSSHFMAAAGDGPLIPEDRLVASAPSGESLLEEYLDKDKQGEFEEGEAEEGDTEWTQFADGKEEIPVAENSIDMDEFPTSVSGLHETLAGLRRAETLNQEGETLAGKNRFAAAAEKFSGAVEINPKYVDALVNRGVAFTELGRVNDALQDFNRALRLEKHDPEIYNRRGEIYLQNSVPDQAIRDFTAALVLNPLYSIAYLNRGRAYTEKGMAAEAQADFDQAMRTDFDQSPLALAGRVFEEVDLDVAADGSREEIEKLRQQGEAELEKGAYDGAVATFSKVIDLSPSDTAAYCSRGRAYTGLEQLDKAMDDFNRALDLDVLAAPLYYWRARAWEAKGDLESMLQDLKLSCELGHEPACLAWEKLRRQSPSPEA